MACTGTSSVLKLNELNRIRSQCTTNKNQIESKEERLREASQNRAAKWGNTLEAQRKNKELRKKKEREETEKYFKKLDQEEAKIREEKRQKALARAGKIQFLQNERVKAMNAVLHQADIMEEWNDQKQIKEKMKKLEKNRDKLYHVLEQEEMKRYDEKENTKRINMRKKKRETARMQQEQLKEKHKLKDLKKQMVQEDRKNMLEHISKINLDAQIKLEKQQQHHEQMKEQMVTELNDQLKIKSQQQKEEKILDEKILKYSQEKDRIENERKLKQARIKKEKQAIRQKLIDDQVALLTKLKSEQNVRLETQQQESEQKFLDVERQKIEKREKLLRECIAYTSIHMDRKERETQKELEEDIRRGKLAEEDTLAYEKSEAEKFARFRKESMKVRKFQKQQILTQHCDKYRKELEIKTFMKNQIQESNDLDQKVLDYVKKYDNENKNLSHFAKEIVRSHVNRVKHKY